MEVEIEVFERKSQNKGDIKRLRRENKVPVVIYSQGKEGENGTITKESFDAVLRDLEQGFLPSTIFVLKTKSGKKRKAIIKDIQYDVTSYNVLHIDFLELVDGQEVSLNIPLQCLGEADCVGVKGGGYLRPMMRHVKVKCLPKYIPESFQIDIRDLDIRQNKRVSDIKFPEHVTSLVRPEEVVATIVK